jgi:hypothetical protein
VSGAPEAASPPRRGRKPGTVGPRIDGGSVEARKTAAVILEVLGGLRTPTDAAKALGVSTQRYYGLEAQALEGLVHACERRGPGRQRTTSGHIAALEAKVTQLERECARRQALIRVSQRTLGLAKPAEPLPPAPGKRRRKPAIRALKAAAELDKSMAMGDQSRS